MPWAAGEEKLERYLVRRVARKVAMERRGIALARYLIASFVAFVVVVGAAAGVAPPLICKAAALAPFRDAVRSSDDPST